MHYRTALASQYHAQHHAVRRIESSRLLAVDHLLLGQLHEFDSPRVDAGCPITVPRLVRQYISQQLGRGQRVLGCIISLADVHYRFMHSSAQYCAAHEARNATVSLEHRDSMTKPSKAVNGIIQQHEV